MQTDFENILFELQGIQAQLDALGVLYAEASSSKTNVNMSSETMCDLFRGFSNHLERINSDFMELLIEQKEKPQTPPTKANA